jgi:hypothetical protein
MSQTLRPAAADRFGGATQQLVRIGHRQGPAEKKALRFLALMFLQEQELREALDALRGYFDAQ